MFSWPFLRSSPGKPSAYMDIPVGTNKRLVLTGLLFAAWAVSKNGVATATSLHHAQNFIISSRKWEHESVNGNQGR